MTSTFDTHTYYETVEMYDEYGHVRRSRRVAAIKMSPDPDRTYYVIYVDGRRVTYLTQAKALNAARQHNTPAFEEGWDLTTDSWIKLRTL